MQRQILLDEYKECAKRGDLACLSRSVTPSLPASWEEIFQLIHRIPVTTQSASGTKVEVEDDSAGADKQKLINNLTRLVGSDEGVVTTRPTVDTDGLERSTSGFTGLIHWKSARENRAHGENGSRDEAKPESVPGCPGEIAYVEEGYEHVCSDHQLVKFGARIKKMMGGVREHLCQS